MQDKKPFPNDPAFTPPFRYEFEKMESIAQDVSRFIKMNWPSDYGLLDDFKEFISDQVDIIRDNLINTTFTFEDERYVERYIQYHQRALTRITGNLLSFAKPENLYGPASGATLLIQYVYQSLQKLLNFIENHFSKYFDQHACIPPSYRKIVIHEIGKDLEEIRIKLISTGITELLITIVMKPVDDFVKDENEDVTYNRVMFLKELKRQLSAVSRSVNVGWDADESLLLDLVYLNCNSPELYSYCINKLSIIRDQAESVENCIEQLALFQKEVKQISLKPGFALSRELPSLKKQLCHWIEKEIAFQEKKKNLRISEETTEMKRENAPKFDIDLSVDMLGYFYRVLADLEIITNRNYTKLFELIARVFKTDRTQAMREGTVKNGFYKAEIGTKKAIQKLLQRMLEYVNGDIRKGLA